jgi:hypothetical protein
MSAKIEVLSFSRDADDYRGKTQTIVYHIVIGGREKAVGKADLLRAIEMNLPEQGSEETQAVGVNGSG